MLLHYVGEDHEDTVYESNAPEGSRIHWPSNKFKIGLDFPNLPYYIDEDLKLTDSAVILKHLGRKYDLFGSNEKEMARIDMLFHTAHDIRRNVSDLSTKMIMGSCI